MSKHYHVIAGLQGGYIPNTNEVWQFKGEALDAAAWIVDGYRDAEQRVVGSKRAGFWQAREMSMGGFADYVEVTGPCFDPDCQTWTDLEV